MDHANLYFHNNPKMSLESMVWSFGTPEVHPYFLCQKAPSSKMQPQPFGHGNLAIVLFQ